MKKPEPGWIEPISAAGGIPLMRLEPALEGVPAVDVVTLLADGDLTLYRAGDELLASRPTIEIALRARRDRRSATYGKVARYAG